MSLKVSLKLIDDPREIAWISFEEGNCVHQVGVAGCTKIEAYGECGEWCMLPWFAVWHGELLSYRINANYIAAVKYKEDV